jgi:hypothetical protein
VRVLTAAVTVTALVGVTAWISRPAHNRPPQTPDRRVDTAVALAASGSLTCNITGTAAFTPALPHANPDGSSGSTAFALNATLTNCDNSSLAPGVLPVTGGTVVVKGTVDSGASCADLLAGPEDISFDPSTLRVTLVRQRPGGTAFRTTLPSDVSYVSLTDPSGYDLTGWTYTSDALNSVAFNGETITVALRADNFLPLGGCIAGRSDLSSVSFSASDSSLSITP